MKSIGHRVSMLTSAAVLSTAAVLALGCGSGKPEVITAGGTITLNGEPLNNAEVRFIPMHEGLDGNYIARGVSDDEGKFVLNFPGQDQSGVVLGENKVLVLEGPVPDAARGQSEEGQIVALKHAKTLKQRPIPKIYSSLSESPLSFDVTAEKNEYVIELKRGF